MYCCACGCVLTAENSAGLVCVSCKLPACPRGQGRRSKGVLLFASPIRELEINAFSAPIGMVSYRAAFDTLSLWMPIGCPSYRALCDTLSLWALVRL